VNRRTLLISSLALLGSAAVSGGGAAYALNAAGLAPKPPAPADPVEAGEASGHAPAESAATPVEHRPGAPAEHGATTTSAEAGPAAPGEHGWSAPTEPGSTAASERTPSAGGPHWEYEQGPTGPDAWGQLDPSFGVCQQGGSQSPVDLKGALRVPSLTGLKLEYASTRVKVTNNGHTFQVNVDQGSSLTIDGKRFDLVQFHFHTPSEHTVDGKSYPMELHLVHQAADRNLAVIGVILVEGGPNATLARFWERLPKQPSEVDTGQSIELKDLLPRSTDDYFTYAGSLTTPPCTESVRWIVLQQPVSVSRSQVEKFRAVFLNNARPVMPIGARSILTS
jgi:carbonic anhydrase